MTLQIEGKRKADIDNKIQIGIFLNVNSQQFCVLISNCRYDNYFYC